MKPKTNKSVAKRFRVTGSGKLKFKKSKLRHNLGNKSRNQKRGFRASGYVTAGDAQRLFQCMPWGLD